MNSVITPNGLNDNLQNLLDRCDFLQLTNSTTEFPGSAGSGLPIIRLSTPACTALIALQGAHLLSFQATGGTQLLWVSPNCNFTPEVALRGGVPVCLPWFGPNIDPKKPKHGFARNSDWQLADANLLSNGDAQLTFTFASSANALFDFDFTTQLVMTLGEKIKFDLHISNTDSKAFDCSWVLHSYHPITSLADVRVKGLAGKTYLDNLEKHAVKIQVDDVSFPAEVDRVFPGIANELEIIGTPNIVIRHHNCPSVVVWNPGATNAANIGDIGAGNEQDYICVERGAVLAEKWALAAGETKSAWVEIGERK